ncbi:N-acetylneuraminate synthase family protein [Candidatus Pelagibacter bacterium nBUS_33]|jgi:sialic acid synthase SpsE|uniref:N-acetylneuraminate synthase family protein n=1 Tax=Candidatus Pelagibacter bacterium nBUS_33 TaxID=3374193 RepID=UPI003EBF83F8
MKIKIGNKIISEENPTYFIADIASNHDGSLNKAKELIHMASESGADAAKFQNFYASTLVSDYGFRNLKKTSSHQNRWKKSVYETYKENEISLKWTEDLARTCKKYNIEYFTASYDMSINSYINKFVNAWKIGSGDITWHEHILKISKSRKPVIIATGASNLYEVKKILEKVKKINKKIILMQCNTNYTNQFDNFNFINLNVLKTYKKKFPNIIYGLSDHTMGHETVLGAISLGARVIEKHFTDSNLRNGPDHKFSMNPKTWRAMIDSARILELALGKKIKKVEKNEKDTVILQRRSIRVKRNLKKNEILKKEDCEYLRPCPNDALPVYELGKILDKKIKFDIKKYEYIKKKFL